MASAQGSGTGQSGSWSVCAPCMIFLHAKSNALQTSQERDSSLTSILAMSHF